MTYTYLSPAPICLPYTTLAHCSRFEGGVCKEGWIIMRAVAPMITLHCVMHVPMLPDCMREVRTRCGGGIVK